MCEARAGASDRAAGRRAAARVLIVPGLRDSGPAHWQTWLQSLHRGAVRVEQDDWHAPDLAAWSARVAETLERAGPGPWLAVAHSFGVLALVHALGSRADLPVVASLLVAPADPEKFGLQQVLPRQALPVPSVLVASETDPWMSLDGARHWALLWRAHWVNLGDAGHVNAESGFGPLPLAQRWVGAALQRLERDRRFERAAFPEWSFAV